MKKKHLRRSRLDRAVNFAYLFDIDDGGEYPYIPTIYCRSGNYPRGPVFEVTDYDDSDAFRKDPKFSEFALPFYYRVVLI